MKSVFALALIVIFSLLVIPLSALSTQPEPVLPTSNAQTDIAYEKDKPLLNFEKIRVNINGTVSEFSTKDYVFGVVAAEMPALYHEEALKAQAVAAYTFACYKMNGGTEGDYDISADPNIAQSFITREQANERWGEKAEEYTKKIDSCIEAVSGQLLTYENAPIFAAYHAISSGSTNSCSDVWGKDLPYLKSRDSFGDTLANGYLSELTLTAEEISQQLKSFADSNGTEAKDYFKDRVVTDNGYVKSITYCGKKLTGSEIAKALDLRSSNFEVSFNENNFTFKVKGYGHGVGLSQTGADYMAKGGSSYQEIVLHYYKGATLKK